MIYHLSIFLEQSADFQPLRIEYLDKRLQVDEGQVKFVLPLETLYFRMATNATIQPKKQCNAVERHE